MFAVLPDVDQAVITYFAQHPTLLPLHQGRVSTLLQSPATSLRVANIGGPGGVPWEAATGFQLECWGGSQQQANELARRCVAVTFEVRDVPVAGGRIKHGAVSLAPFWRPDENGRPRYILQIEVTSYPEEQT